MCGLAANGSHGRSTAAPARSRLPSVSADLADLAGTLLVLGVAVATYTAATSLGAASVAFVGIYVAWQIVRRRGRTPGWRTVLGGGAAAAVPFGVIAALPILTVLDATSVPGFAMTAAVMVLPLVPLFSLGAAAVVEGFRAAAS